MTRSGCGAVHTDAGRRRSDAEHLFLTLVFAVPLGMLVAQGRMSRRRLVRSPLSFYIYIMRSTPLMLQIMFIYFLLPQVLPFRVDRFWAVIFAFVINYAAYFAEIFRSGIMSIDKGQMEAGRSLGLNYLKTMWFVIAPQVLKNVRVADKTAAKENPAVQEAVKAVAERLGDDGRILVRESGTEPVIRVMGRGGETKLCEQCVDDVIAVMQDQGVVAD